MKIRKGLLLLILWVGILLLAGLTIGFIINHFSVTEKESYAPNIKKWIYKDGTEQLNNTFTGDPIGPRADVILEYSDDTLVSYRRNGRFGYFNIITGKNVIPSVQHNFDFVWEFEDESGLAAVLENDKIGFIRKDGSWQIPPQYPYTSLISDETDIQFSDGYCTIPAQNNEKLGLIDTQNRVILPFIYDYIEDQSEGFRIVGINGRYGLLDSTFTVRIPLVYADMWINPQGIVLLDTIRFNQQLLGFDLRTVISEYAFDDISPMKTYEDDPEDEELNYDDEETDETIENQTGYSTFTIHGKMGAIINSTGKVIIEAKWDDILFISDGIFKAELDGKYFLIDASGKFIL